MDLSRIFKYVSIGLIVILLFGLGAWYVFLRSQTSEIQTAAEGRGFSGAVPRSSTLGSTFSNIISGFKRTPSQARDTLTGTTKSFESGISNFSQGVKDAFGNLISNFASRPDESEQQRPKTPRLWQAQKTPIAGFRFIASTTPTVRFMERSSGHIFDINVETGDVQRITNTLIPRVYEARFSRDGSPVLKTFEQGVTEVFTGIISTTTEGISTLTVTSLGNNVLDFIPNARNKELLTLVEGVNGSAVIRSSWNGSNPTTVFSSSLKGWKLYWTPDNKIYLSQNAATKIPGSAYELTREGRLVPLVRSIAGLTILPRATSTALIIGSDDGSVSLSGRASASEELRPLPIRTTADKCVSGGTSIAYCAVPASISSARFIDEWYRGETHTADSWWRIDLGTGTAELLFSPARESNTSLDVESPRLDDRGEYIAFIDARDKSLWILRIKE